MKSSNIIIPPEWLILPTFSKIASKVWEDIYNHDLMYAEIMRKYFPSFKIEKTIVDNRVFLDHIHMMNLKYYIIIDSIPYIEKEFKPYWCLQNEEITFNFSTQL